MKVGLSLMPQAGFYAAAAPIFASGQVEAVEWTIDIGFGKQLPGFITKLLEFYGPKKRLYGHSTGYSPMSAGRADRAEIWLDQAAAAIGAHRYRHLTEHYGVATGGPFVFGSPMPSPGGSAVIDNTAERMIRLRERVSVPVGLEILALAFSRDDLFGQAATLCAVLERIDGILHLDLHNLWTAAVNFDLDPIELAGRFPLHRARIVHVSGGSWVDGIRRDTHDDHVPDEVFALLPRVLPLVPQVEAVILERIGNAFATEADQQAFRDDWVRLRQVIHG